jgi:predicted Zn-dependent protease
MRCQVQDTRSAKAQMDLLAQQLVPTAFQNNRAKLELLEKWPAEEQHIRQKISSGVYQQRRWSDVENIGFRKIQENQKDDIKRGDDAVKELRQTGAMPPELDNKQIQDYVNTVAQKIARNSDLEVPLRVIVLDSKEVNAFALPGGFLFVQRGLLEETDDEAQLAGVLAHEMSHVAARHSWRLYKKALISSIFYQAAQIAALIATGGVSSIGTYYALQYGFYGLGFALDLNLLGVSREYELEADQLGVQYAWKSGYDPEGFIRFFDKMASKHGYAVGVSWFRTHPPFYERMVRSKEEIMYLPQKEALVFQTQEFEQMKRVLKDVSAKSNAAQDAKRPSLLGKEEKCEKPQELYKPQEPIEDICNRLPDSGS